MAISGNPLKQLWHSLLRELNHWSGLIPCRAKKKWGPPLITKTFLTPSQKLTQLAATIKMYETTQQISTKAKLEKLITNQFAELKHDLQALNEFGLTNIKLETRLAKLVKKFKLLQQQSVALTEAELHISHISGQLVWLQTLIQRYEQLLHQLDGHGLETLTELRQSIHKHIAGIDKLLAITEAQKLSETKVTKVFALKNSLIHTQKHFSKLQRGF